MPGKEARDGFWYQDAKALCHLLVDAIARLRKRILGEDPGPLLRVGVECPVPIGVDDPDAEDATEVIDDRTTWDAIFARDDQFVVDECKLGGPSKPDRLTFYHRLRSTIEGNVLVDRLTPRLTVGRGSVDPEIWREFAVLAHTIESAVKPPARADTAEKLVAEALYYLVTSEPEWISESDKKKGRRPPPATPPLRLDDARALMSRLVVDDSETREELEARLNALLVELGAKLSVAELVHALGGWINEAARQRPWRDDLTADSMAEKLELYGRYVNTPIATEQLWHRLRQFLPALPPSEIPPQPWRDVQPSVDLVEREVVDAKRVVLTSEGGVGKSYLLALLHAEQAGPRIWIDSIAPLHDVEQAVALGAWWVPHDQVLTVFIDAIDQLDDPAALLGAVDRALTTRKRSVVYAAARFATWATLRNDMPGWSSVRLERWENDRIRALAQAGRTELLSGDLVDLLRTPLLLDLFLRTFAAGVTVPGGLATRHGVLREYFDRRVLFDERAGERRDILDSGVETILANALAWRSSTTAARDLVSEGVLLRVFGDLRFRHALLRDYAAAIQFVARSAEDIALVLEGVTSPIVRNELLRGVIEAQLDPDRPSGGPSVAEIVDACTRHDLAPGIALGTTDAPTSALVQAIASLDNGAVLRQAVEHAQLIDNRAWLRVPGMIGGTRPSWFGAEHLLAMSALAEFANANGDASNVELAVTLRTWTMGHVVAEEGPWPIANIGRLLVRVLPEDDTVRWYESLDVTGSNVLANFLEPLRDLSANVNLDEETLLRTLRKVVFCLGDRTVRGHVIWEVTHLLLCDHRKKPETPGLLTTQPFIGLSLLFDLSVLDVEADRRRGENWRTDPALAELLASFVGAAEPDPAEEQLRRTPRVTEADARGDLVDDVKSWQRDIGPVMDTAKHRAEEDPEFAACFARAAVASRSVRARVLALQLPTAASDDSTRVMFRDPRLYHVRAASRALREVIAACWSALPPELREHVQANVLDTARSATMMSHVGRLASAVPRGELVAALVPYVEHVERQATNDTSPISASASDYGDDDDGDEPPPVLAQSVADPAHQIEELAKVLESDDAAAAQAVVVLRQMLDADELGEVTLDRVWYAISRVVTRDEQNKNDKRLTADDATRLFEVALCEAARRRAKHDTWGVLLDIADACPTYVSDEAARELHRRLRQEAIDVVGANAERQDLAEIALRNLRPVVWLDVPSGARAIFEDWFRNWLRGDALRMAFRLVQFLDGKTQLHLLRHLLETPGRLETTDAIGFADDAGYKIAALSLWWREDAARERFAAWCTDVQRAGSLADNGVWQTLLSRFAWCLQNEARETKKATDKHAVMIERLVPLMTLAWSAWVRVIDDAAERNLSVGWSVVAPLAREFEGVVAPVGGWSATLRQLIERVITEGGRNDISALEDVRWNTLEQQTLATAARAVVSRARLEVAKRPATDWMIGSLVNVLGLLGIAPAVPLDEMRAVLDCLHYVGRSVKRANVLASTIARQLQAREASA